MSIHSLSIHHTFTGMREKNTNSRREFLVNQMSKSITRIIFSFCFIVEYYFHYACLNMKFRENYDHE
jgi:hypothetical protein